jgi:hypothetical protein
MSIDEIVTIGRESLTDETSQRSTNELDSSEYSPSTITQNDNVASCRSVSLLTQTSSYAITGGIRKASKIFLTSYEDDWVVVEGYKIVSEFVDEGKQQILLRNIGNSHT